MKILITGGAGFIGSHLTDALLSEGHQVTIIDNLSSGNKAFVSSDAEFIQMDIKDENVLSLFQSHHFDIVYHEAAQTMVPVSISHPKFDAEENIIGLLNILESARKTEVNKIIFSSSAAVYGDNPNLPLAEDEIPAPTSFYGLTKWMTEKYLALYHSLFGINYTVLRYSNVYGPRQGANGEGGVIYLFAKALTNKNPITIFGNGKQTRDFISVHDVVSANLAAARDGNQGIFNVSTESELSIRDLATTMINLTALDSSLITFAPERAGDIFRSSLCNKNIKKSLNWSPSVNILDGLEDTLDFFYHNKNTLS